MNRRDVLMGVGAACVTTVAGCSSLSDGQVAEASEDTPTRERPDEEPSDSVKRAIGEFKQEVEQRGVNGVELLVKPDGEKMLLRFTTKRQPKLGFETVALAYTSVLANRPEIPTLTIRTGGVEALVPIKSAKAHANGQLKDNAFLETLVIRDVNAPTSTPTDS